VFKLPNYLTPLMITGSAVFLSANPVFSQSVPVTGVKLNPNQNQGLQLILETPAGSKPQVFTITKGNQFTADILNSQLRLPSGNSFRQDNPMKGINSVVINQLDANSIRVTITGANFAPKAEIIPNNGQGVGFTISADGNANMANNTANNPNNNGLDLSNQITPVIANNNNTNNPNNNTVNNTSSVAPVPTKEPILPKPDAIIPNPEIKIEGQPAGATNNIVQPVAPVPPLLPRAIAPPIGDIAVSNIDVSASNIDLASNTPVKLVVQNAPVKDVLTLLARTAGLNVVFLDGGTAGAAGTTAGTTVSNTVSLDIENEPVQNVFNYVLRMSGMEANKSDRTVFIGAKLPDTTRNIIMRTLRLNQIKATMPESSLSVTQNSGSNISSSGQGSNSTLGRTSQSSFQIPLRGALQILEAMGANGKGETPGPGATPSSGATTVLKGLQATADARTNTVTLVGPPNLVEIGSAHLAQLDVRKRQVAINVKIVEINLNNNESFDSNFAFAIGDNYISAASGKLNVNVGPLRPPSSTVIEGNTFGRPIVGNPLTGTRDITTTDSFTRIDPYASFFTTDPTKPLSKDISYSVVPDPIQTLNNPNTSAAPRYYDVNGVPRLYSELALPGSAGTIPALINPTTGIVPATSTVTSVPLFYDQNRIARPLNQLNLQGLGFTNLFPADLKSQYENPANPRPLLNTLSNDTTTLVPAIVDATTTSYTTNRYFGVDGKIYPLNDLTIGGGTIQPLINALTGLVPASVTQNVLNTIQTTGTYELPSYFQYPSRLLGSIQAQVVSGNAKILTDPTLIVQEGNQSQFSLTTGILTGIKTTTTYPTSGPPVQTVETTTGEVGVILNINVDQIDDNGFISMSVSPEVSAPGDTKNLTSGQSITLINRRRLETGNIRLRDGQTLILTGIIQETDQTTVSKVPILGDLPLIGSLFRKSQRNNQRQEVVVLVTPQVMDDSDRSTFGYNYTPSQETRQILKQKGFPIQPR
jgi:type II secretory pathway component HofQ